MYYKGGMGTCNFLFRVGLKKRRRRGRWAREGREAN
jgi:hypothetical protein